MKTQKQYANNPATIGKLKLGAKMIGLSFVLSIAAFYLLTSGVYLAGVWALFGTVITVILLIATLHILEKKPVPVVGQNPSIRFAYFSKYDFEFMGTDIPAEVVQERDWIAIPFLADSVTTSSAAQEENLLVPALAGNLAFVLFVFTFLRTPLPREPQNTSVDEQTISGQNVCHESKIVIRR
jgi:hypothetical protein